MSPRSPFFAFCSFLLIAAIALVIFGSTRPQARTFHGKLIDLIPEAPPGWTRTLRPIADTLEMQKKTAELLNFDDGVFVEYTYGRERLSVYVAYWTPGRMSHRLVAGHTPDVCWVGAGWTCTERGTWPNEPSQQSDGPTVFAQRAEDDRIAILPAESRTFTARGTTEYVWFWHLVGGQPISYGPQAPPWYASLADTLSKGLDQREEQFFIRISSPRQLDDSVIAPVRNPILRWINSLGS